MGGGETMRRAEIYWLETKNSFKIGILPRPRAGEWLEEEIEAWQESNIQFILSPLTPEEIRELDLFKEPNLCESKGMAFFSFPIPDRGVPDSYRKAKVLVRKLVGLIQDGKTLGIHCRMGIGRSSLMAACILGALEENPKNVFDLIGKARKCPVPDTEEQREWFFEFMDHYNSEDIF